MNDLGLHAWHVPLRLGWQPSRVYAVLQNLIEQRPDASGASVVCDTIENATVVGTTGARADEFPVIVETKRIDPGQSNTWKLRVVGLDGAVEFSTAEPKTLRTLHRPGTDGAPAGSDQVWQHRQVGSQSIWPTVTGGIFEFGFSDAILQMWAAFLAERAGQLGDRFGCVTPREAAATHRIYGAALASQRAQTVQQVVTA